MARSGWWNPASNQLAIDAARRYSHRLAILGHFPLDRPKSRVLVAGWKRRPRMPGRRLTFLQPQQRTRPTDGTMDWLWPAAERDGLPVASFAFDFLPVVDQIAHRHPGLRLLVDHPGGRGGTGATKDAAALAHLPNLLALARYPNLAVKATGVPGYSSEPYPDRNLHPYLRPIYNAFGPERLF
jgi:hypothetical protein